MTSDEIRKRIEKFDYETSHREDGLWEIAYQLAVMNEQRSKQMGEILRQGDTLQESFQSLGSPVGADSDKTVRGDCTFSLAEQVAIEHCRCLLVDAPNAFSASVIGRAVFAMLRVLGGLPIAHERTTRPDPQAASIQTKKEE